ncbi:MAG: precorrin-2 C(20)-methyltransferase [Chloroflexota bacterium]
MKLTAVGVGPGDPELITVKGLKRLQNAELIFVPRSRDGSISLAQRIVEMYIQPTQVVVPLPLPMTRDPRQLVPAWEAAAALIEETFVAQGAENGVYLLLGDPLLYGTFTYIWERLATQSPHIAIEIVPGVTSFAATAAMTQTILSTTNDRLAILPASYETDQGMLTRLLQQFDTIILMKVGPVLPQILAALEKLGLLETAVYGERVGMPEEVVVTDLRSMVWEKRPYLSLLIITKGKNA